MGWRRQKNRARVHVWDVLAASRSLLVKKTVSTNKLTAAVKTVVIGAVPDRGGVPEGYTLEDVAKDVTKANIGLAMKDAPAGKGASTMAQLSLASAKRWVGKDMGLDAGGSEGFG